MAVSFRPCALIPVYNHKNYLAEILDYLVALNLPVFLINDGSDENTTSEIQRLAQRPTVTLIPRVRNGGKGEAVKDGLWKAYQEGYTHALQVDADGQHQLEDIPAMLREAQRSSVALVLGEPAYGQDAPLGRLLGRQISRFWVWLETLSTAIRDPLIGFRVYPLTLCASLISQGTLGSRMEFDVQILVRLYWAGALVSNVPTTIRYPKGGLSHFRMFWDNVRISRAHAGLFFGMLPRLPRLLFYQGRLR
ncbi:MAG TPA: glycosyltransferase family 2 protein [Fibrobacteraceae bacterium]|nr:glycosyltransferase family 2 protein [Fibrobacteraceae bacterium]